MDIQENEQSPQQPISQKQTNPIQNKPNNDISLIHTPENQLIPNHSKNSLQGRFSNQSFMSFGRMSVEEPVFCQNQKISLQSNISGKARQIFEQKDLFENLAQCGRSSFHQDLFIRDEGSFKQFDIQHKVSQTSHNHQVHFPIFGINSGNNFGFGHQPHSHLSSPTHFNLSSQEFKQRSSEGTSSVPGLGMQHSAHNQSQSIIKTKNYESQFEPITTPNKTNQPKLQQVEAKKQAQQKVISCKCPRSKCLLMYCECFSKGIMCNPTCSCYQCRNNPDFQQKRQNARRIVLERDPNAFSNKLQVVGGQQSSELAYKRGCNCKKTNCFKKYCQCFYAGVKCTYLCKCQNCMNGGENAYKG